MQREIKFRAWLKGMMVYNHSVSISIGGVVHYLDTDGEWKCDIEGNGEDIGVDLMQYTGLKDRNGKEIYEGDIIKKHFGSSIPVFVVTWHPDRLMFIQGSQYNEPLYELPLQYLEVIGNIYENPELLKQPA